MKQSRGQWKRLDHRIKIKLSFRDLQYEIFLHDSLLQLTLLE